MKKILAVMMCCVMFVLAFAGCSGNDDGAVEAFENYVSAQKNAESTEKLYPQELMDYIRRVCTERDCSEEEIQNEIAEECKPLIMKMDFAKIYAMDGNYKDAFTFSWELVDKKVGSKSEVAELNEYAKSKMGFTGEIEEAVAIKSHASITANKDDKELIKGNRYGVSIKIDGKWYYLADSRYCSQVWCEPNNVMKGDCVEWVMDFLYN